MAKRRWRRPEIGEGGGGMVNSIEQFCRPGGVKERGKSGNERGGSGASYRHKNGRKWGFNSRIKEARSP